MLLNLVLDTNTWLYLSYGFDTISSKTDENLHFELIEQILDKITNHECHIFTNYIIKEEWRRNKEKTNVWINKYKNTLRTEENKLKNNRKSKDFLTLASTFKQVESDLKNKIQKNLQHIENVDKLIQNSRDIPVLDKHKLEAVELALQKKPPFHHKENSVADAIIFLSTIDYFYHYDDDEFQYENTIFISNNSSDFGESVKSEKLHPELAKMLENKPILFERNLGIALNLGQNIISKYRDYLAYNNRDSIMCMMYCKGEEYFMGEVEFNQKIQFKKDDFDYSFDKNQLFIEFDKEFQYNLKDFVKGLKKHLTLCDYGTCNFCDTEHFRCECGEEYAITGNLINCPCGKSYDLTHMVIKDDNV